MIKFKDNKNSLTNKEFVTELINEFVKKVGNGKYAVFSHKGKRLSKPSSKKKSLKRLKQIEYFKNK